MRKYETLVIMRPALEEEQMSAVLDEVRAIVSRQGGQITRVDVWGLRRLEYPIKHEDSGNYAVVNFTSEASAVKEMERVMGIRDDVLRTKTVVIGKE